MKKQPPQPMKDEEKKIKRHRKEGAHKEVEVFELHFFIPLKEKLQDEERIPLLIN